jgi:hypothetical protein
MSGGHRPRKVIFRLEYDGKGWQWVLCIGHNSRPVVRSTKAYARRRNAVKSARRYYHLLHNMTACPVMVVIAKPGLPSLQNELLSFQAIVSVPR